MRIPFATQSYKLPSLKLSAQRCINMFAEREPKDARDEIPVISAPGLRSFATMGTGPIRGLHTFLGTLYVVSGTILYSVSSAGLATVVGSAIPGNDPVSMADNGAAGQQMCIVNGTSGFVYSPSGGFQIINDPNFFPANTVTFFDNYFVFDKVGTNQFFLSNLLNGLVYQATNFGSVDGLSGNLVSVQNQLNMLLLFGETHIEAWWDSGAANFPFQRYIGGTVERGCIGALATLKDDNSVWFLGDDRMYYRLDGTVPHRVSQHAIEQDIDNVPSLTGTSAFSYTFGGHKFIVLNIPSIPRTYVYDVSTGLWHERVSWDMFGHSLGMWRSTTHAVAYNQDFFGDQFSGNIGVLDPTIFTEYGNIMQAQVVSPPVHNNARRVFHQRLEVIMRVGEGVAVGQGSAPLVMMDYSDDGGYTFSTQRTASLGRAGEYGDRVYWTRLGQSRQRVYRLTISDPVPRTIISAYAELKAGVN